MPRQLAARNRRTPRAGPRDAARLKRGAAASPFLRPHPGGNALETGGRERPFHRHADVAPPPHSVAGRRRTKRIPLGTRMESSHTPPVLVAIGLGNSFCLGTRTALACLPR